jgi:LysR family transcriptional regulator, transcriptional activator of the cysJI operon
MNGVSQSAASQHIHELEKDLEVALLDRSTRPLAATAAGELYSKLCREVLQKKEEFDLSLDRLKKEISGVVRVASIYSVGLSEMSNLEAQFSLRFPDATLVVDYLRPEKVYEAILEDRADLGLVSYPEPTRDLAVIPWRQEEMVVAASPRHALAGKNLVSPAELQGLTFIAFDEDLPIRRQVDKFLSDNHVQVDVTMHFDVIQMIKEAVAIGSGVSILPLRIMRPEIEQGRLVAIQLKLPGLVRPLGILYRKKKNFTRATEAFLQLLQEEPVAEPQPVG